MSETVFPNGAPRVDSAVRLGLKGDAALGYARQGFCVFPVHTVASGKCSCGKAECGSAGKHPRIDEWPSQATTDSGRIIEWWVRWPDANIGIATGQKSGLVVLDVDVKNGVDGVAFLESLQSRFGRLPATRIVLSGSGGVHYYFRYPKDRSVGCATHIFSTPEQQRTGLDVKGTGGYIIAPPSTHASGRDYAWDLATEEVLLPELPAWLPGGFSIQNKVRPSVTPELIQDGTRDETVWATLNRHHRLGASMPELEMLAEFINCKCNPQLSEVQLKA